MDLGRRPVRRGDAHLLLGVSFPVAVFAAGIFWFFAFFVPERRQAAIDGVRRELSLRADLRRDLLDRRIRNLTDDVTFVAAFPSVRALLTRDLPAGEAAAEASHLRGILADFRRNYRQESASILDTSGRVVASAGDSGPGRASRALAVGVALSGVPAFDLVQRSDGRARVACAAPVAGTGAGVPVAAGAVLSEGDAAALLFDLLEKPTAASSSETLLVRVEGSDVTFLSPLRFRPDRPLTVRLPLSTTGLAARSALEGKEAFGEFADYRGARVLAATRRLANVPWGLVVKIDRDEALSAFRRDVLQRGVTWGLLLAALCVAAAALWRSAGAARDLALARSEARFRDLFEQANDAVFLIGRDRRIREANRAAEEMYGWSRDELAGRDVADFRPEGQREMARAHFAAADRGERLVFESEHVRADGSRFTAEVSTRLVEGPDGPVHLSLVRDISERKEAENRIRSLNRVLRTISEVNQLIVRATDEAALLKDVCEILSAHGGYALAWIGRADPGTKTVVPVASAGRETGYLGQIHVRWDDTPEGRGPAGTAIREGRPIVVSDIRGDATVEPWRTFMLRHGFSSMAGLPIRRGGAVGACLVVYSGETGFIGDEEISLLGELTGDLSFALDAMDRREALEKAEAQLAQAQKMEAIGRLAGGVAHDFNNLLTVIQGYGELLAMSLAEDPESRESVGEIVRAAERASALTRQLLAFSRRQVLETKVFDLGAVVADTEKMLRRLIGEDVEVAVVRAPRVGPVRSDPGQIEQVVLNLAVNARDAMPRGGRLTIALAEEEVGAPRPATPDVIPPGRYVVLSMTDTGTGMDAETLAHVFEPFFTTKERGKGTGLGLSTVYGIVRQSGGYVAVESVPGAGTTFRIYLTRCHDPVPSGDRRQAFPANGNETVLVVEDEESVRNLSKAILERHGYTVLTAGNGEAALALLASDPREVHVLLTDLVMPGMTGKELAARVRALRPAVKVVTMSGYAAEALPDPGEASGFLAKPFSERALAAKIREALEAPEP